MPEEIVDFQEAAMTANVEFVNTRFDPDLTPFHDLAQQMAASFGQTADLQIDKQFAHCATPRYTSSS